MLVGNSVDVYIHMYMMLLCAIITHHTVYAIILDLGDNESGVNVKTFQHNYGGPSVPLASIATYGEPHITATVEGRRHGEGVFSAAGRETWERVGAGQLSR